MSTAYGTYALRSNIGFQSRLVVSFFSPFSRVSCPGLVSVRVRVCTRVRVYVLGVSDGCCDACRSTGHRRSPLILDRTRRLLLSPGSSILFRGSTTDPAPPHAPFSSHTRVSHASISRDGRFFSPFVRSVRQEQKNKVEGFKMKNSRAHRSHSRGQRDTTRRVLSGSPAFLSSPFLPPSLLKSFLRVRPLSLSRVPFLSFSLFVPLRG